jgi:hypothetical protein
MMYLVRRAIWQIAACLLCGAVAAVFWYHVRIGVEAQMAEHWT